MTAAENAQMAADEPLLVPWVHSENNGFVSIIYSILRMGLMGVLGLWVLGASVCLAPIAGFFFFFFVLPAALFMAVPAMVMLAAYEGIKAVRSKMTEPALPKQLTQQEGHPDVAGEEMVPVSPPITMLFPDVGKAVAEPLSGLGGEEIQPVIHAEKYENHIDKKNLEESGSAPVHLVAEEVAIETSPVQVPAETWKVDKSPMKHHLRALISSVTHHQKGPHQEPQSPKSTEGSDMAHTPSAEIVIEEQVRQVDVAAAPAVESSSKSLGKKLKQMFRNKSPRSSHETFETESVKSSEGPPASIVSPRYSHDDKTTTTEESISSPMGSETQSPFSASVAEAAPVIKIVEQVDTGADAEEVPAISTISNVKGKSASPSGQRAGDGAKPQPSGKGKGRKKGRNGRH